MQYIKTNELITDLVNCKTQLTVVTKLFSGCLVYSKAKGDSTTEWFNAMYYKRSFMMICTSKYL